MAIISLQFYFSDLMVDQILDRLPSLQPGPTGRNTSRRAETSSISALFLPKQPMS